MPMTRLKDLDELLHGIFVTALEGGIGYWSRCDKYRWSIGDGEVEDLEGFEAVVREMDDDGEEGPELTINREVVLRGLKALAEGTATWGGRELHPNYRAKALVWLTAPASADIDANDADNIVQAGLFGDVRYG
jgi:hypothetical protein